MPKARNWYDILKDTAATGISPEHVSSDVLRAAVQEIEQHRAIGLEGMLRMQRDLQVESFGLDPAELDDEARIEFIRWNVLALTDELHEMLQETGWKPWATSRHVNAEAALKELVDAWHFFMNLLWAIAGPGVLGDAHVLSLVLSGEYVTKRKVNAERQADGYDGVSGKCPDCHRDTDETMSERCTPTEIIRFCPCGHVYQTTTK